MAKVSTEINKLYSFSNQHCFSILKDSVIPNFQAEYKVGYFKLKMPYGKIVCKDISDRDDFRVCKACGKGYYLEDNTCVECMEHCSSCSSADTCSICHDDYLFSEIDGKCIRKC